MTEESPAPALSGFHHLKIPVADLDTSLAWYQRVLGAKHLTRLDHVDSDGIRYATLLEVPGLPVIIELRWAPTAAHALRQCDLIVLALDTDEQFDDWFSHLDAQNVEHSPVLAGGGGPIIVIVDSDGKFTQTVTLQPGDLMSSGTCGGTGGGRTPPEFMHPGDTVTVGVEGVGYLTNPLRAGWDE